MPKDALTLKYSPQPGTREYNTFTEEYFSGTDVTLYLNGEKLTQVTGLQYSVQEQLKPMFGYASRVFDDVAIGNRIIVGSFKVPITNPTANMKVNNSNDIYILNSKINMPSWTVNNVKYKNINDVK